MTADQEGNPQKDSGNSSAPRLKLSAKEAIRDRATGTGSWSLLKNLHMSIVDNGVSILKQGVSKLTGAFRAPEPEASEDNGLAAGPGRRPSAPEVAPVTGGDRPEQAEPLRGTHHGLISNDSEAFGVDWIDNLLDELDSSVLHANQSQASNSVPAIGTVESKEPDPTSSQTGRRGPVEETSGFPGF